VAQKKIANSELTPFELSLLAASKNSSSKKKSKKSSRAKHSANEPQLLISKQKNAELKEKMIASTIGSIEDKNNALSTITINIANENHIKQLSELVKLNSSAPSPTKHTANAGLNRWSTYSSMMDLDSGKQQGGSKKQHDQNSQKISQRYDRKFPRSTRNKEMIKASALIVSGGGVELEHLMAKCSELTDKKNELERLIKEEQAARAVIRTQIASFERNGVNTSGSYRSAKMRDKDLDSSFMLGCNDRSLTGTKKGVGHIASSSVGEEASILSGISASGSGNGGGGGGGGGEGKERKRKVLRKFLFGGGGATVGEKHRTNSIHSTESNGGRTTISSNTSNASEDLLDSKILELSEEVSQAAVDKDRAVHTVHSTSLKLAEKRVRSLSQSQS